ncbi:MAG: CotH kinase family protein [Flavobacteriales bacterium]|jgi:hypothetical protein|nr:CotH kinase family protein [Flavobacteriales bacterium]
MKRIGAGRVMAGTAVVLVLGLVGGWMADRHLKKRHHPGLKRFAAQIVRNYPKGFQQKPLLLELKVKEHDLDVLQQTVDAALERGVILPEDRTTVKGTMAFAGEESNVRLRIKGKMTDHVKGEKWSFRVVARKDGGFLGMKRFSLQHPGTRQYLNEWLHHRLMAGEGIIALRYGFIQLRFNDNDLGIYAYEEHFGPELLENNGRPEGPLFRFDPSLFWEHRLNGINKLRFDEAYAAYQAAAIDAFGTNDMKKDTAARAVFEEAVALMDGVRRAELKVADVFDVDRLAKRHALLDVMGGHHSLDWSDVKFYYDPVVQRVEPVAYESFSAFRIRQVAGAWRYMGAQRESQELHDVYFNDEDFFRAYVHHLERMSRTAYLDSAFLVLGPGLDSASATIFREFPWKELDRSVLYDNQQVIRRVLDVPKGFHAYDHGSVGDTLVMAAVPVEALPIEVHGLLLTNGELAPPVRKTIVPSRRRGRLGVPMELRFVVPDTGLLPATGDRVLEYSVLGAAQRKTLEVFAYALVDGGGLDAFKGPAPDMRDHPFVRVDEQERTVHLLPGTWALTTDLVVPEGYTVRGAAPLDLDLRGGARIVSASPMDLIGLPDMPVRIGSSDRSGGGVLLHGTDRPSTWRHVRSAGFGPSERAQAAIVFHRTRADLHDCALQEDPARDLLATFSSRLVMKGCTLAGGRDQLSLSYGLARIDDLRAHGAGDDAVVVRGGEAEVQRSVVGHAAGVGLKAVAHAQVRATGLHVQARGDGIDLSEGSRAEIDDTRVDAGGHGLDVDERHGRYGPVTVVLNDVELRGEKGELRDKGGNRVERDGRAIGDAGE